jgi:hypothetical protein
MTVKTQTDAGAGTEPRDHIVARSCTRPSPLFVAGQHAIGSVQLQALPGGAGSIDSGNGRRDGAPSGYRQPASYRPL